MAFEAVRSGLEGFRRSNDERRAIGRWVDVAKRDNGHNARVGSILRRLGWVPGHPETRNGARVRVYRPSEGSPTSGVTLIPNESPPDAWIESESSEYDFLPTDAAMA